MTWSRPTIPPALRNKSTSTSAQYFQTSPTLGRGSGGCRWDRRLPGSANGAFATWRDRAPGPAEHYGELRNAPCAHARWAPAAHPLSHG
jgi:hypothetical protein